MPSVNEGVTVSPPWTALSRVTVNVIMSPSAAEALSMVTAALPSSSLRVTSVLVKVSVVTVVVPETDSVSSPSTTASSVGVSENVTVSAVLPAVIDIVRSATVV